MKEAGEAGVPSRHPRSSPMPCPARGCGCTSHLTCRPLCTPGWPRCTQGGDSGVAARRWLGVCQTSRTSSVLRERAGGHRAPAAMPDRDLLTAWLEGAPAWGREGFSSTRVGDPLFSILILEPGWLAYSSHSGGQHPTKDRDPPQPPAYPSHARKRRETQPPTLKPTAGGDAGFSGSAGLGEQRPLHGRGWDE